MNIERIREIIEKIKRDGDLTFEMFGPHSEDTIKIVENALGLRFPGEYRIFLKEFGGGGALDVPLSGIWRPAPFDMGRGSVYGDTLRVRAENKLPLNYIVVFRDDDTRSIWVIDSASVRTDGTVPVVAFPSTGLEKEWTVVAQSYSQFVEQHLSNLL